MSCASAVSSEHWLFSFHSVPVLHSLDPSLFKGETHNGNIFSINKNKANKIVASLYRCLPTHFRFIIEILQNAAGASDSLCALRNSFSDTYWSTIELIDGCFDAELSRDEWINVISVPPPGTNHHPYISCSD